MADSKYSKNCKQSSEKDTQGNKRMTSTEEEVWKQLLVDSVNDTEWFDNAVEVWIICNNY